MKWVAIFVFAACSSKPPPTPQAGSQTAGSGSAEARPYAGKPERGPCQDAHGCKLRNVCGCSCEGVALSAPTQVACDESCPNDDICKGYSLICDMGSQTCGAIPPAK